MQSIICIQSERTILQTQKKQTEQRFYISSLLTSAEHFNKIIRQHWAIENQLHWVLDVVFGEDASKKQDKNSVQNFSLLNSRPSKSHFCFFAIQFS